MEQFSVDVYRTLSIMREIVLAHTRAPTLSYRPSFSLPARFPTTDHGMYDIFHTRKRRGLYYLFGIKMLCCVDPCPVLFGNSAYDTGLI